MNPLSCRLSLGTAQWGARYGITNSRGELGDADVAAIVTTALERGFGDADTHRTTNPLQGYGHAQSRLRPWASRFAITTKVFGGAASDGPITDQLSSSLADLEVSSVHGCLVHDWYDLTRAEAEAAVRELRQVRDRELADRVGISAYEAGDLERAFDLFGPDLGAVQVPTSVIDQRLVGSSIIDRLRASGTEIQVRSVFLQGLLLDPNSPADLARHPEVAGFHRRCVERGVAPLAAALSFIRSLGWVDVVVVGVTSANELAEIADAWALSTVTDHWGEYASGDDTLLDPRRWPRGPLQQSTRGDDGYPAGPGVVDETAGQGPGADSRGADDRPAG